MCSYQLCATDRVWASNLSKDEPPKTIFKAGCDVSASAVSDIDDRFYIIAREKERDDDPV